MKAFRLSDYLKEFILIVTGLAILLVPNILSRIFSLVGIVIIAVNIISAVFGMKTPDKIMKCVGGVILGFVIMLLPGFIEVGIPMVIGFIMFFSGLGRVFGGKSKGTPSLVFGIILTAAGAVFVFSPLTLTTLIKRIIAAVLIGWGIISLIIKLNSGGGSSGNSDIIDINSYSIK